ncbi:MAG: helix-turn-helix domain-containing protein [Proteobacteria bacterium]|nr:helix-turn-helix domain-containing protein [Pseudomonadota bacterium]
MQLRAYLTEHNVSVAAFAVAAGVSVQAVHRYLNGERMPRPAVIERIRIATGGQVSANDLAASVTSSYGLRSQQAEAA